MKSMLKDAGILFAITLVAGLLLGCVYQITKEPIARQEALAQENACREVFSDAENHIPTEIKNKMDAQSDALIAYEKLISSFAKNDDNQFVYPADFAGAYINDKG